MDNLPRVLIISTVYGKATEIAQKIGKEQISRHSHEGDIDYYLWNINNKYYTSQILLCAKENPHVNIPTEGIQALILYHDPQADNAEKNLDQWSSLISSLSEADVLLFTCNAISNVSVKDKIITWCINKKFELVELLDESDSTENLQYDSEHNTYGIERIIEALHAHVWPNILLKGKPSNVDEKESNLDQVANKIENIQLTHNPTEYPNGATIFDAMMDDEDTNFSDLFVHLMTMKEHAASLPTNERRITAEKLVTAFWKLIGEDSEIYD